MAPRKPKAPVRPQWEVCTLNFSHTEYDDSGHRSYKVDEDPADVANKLGADGWEPVTFYRTWKTNWSASSNAPSCDADPTGSLGIRVRASMKLWDLFCTLWHLWWTPDAPQTRTPRQCAFCEEDACSYCPGCKRYGCRPCFQSPLHDRTCRGAGD